MSVPGSSALVETPAEPAPTPSVGRNTAVAATMFIGRAFAFYVTGVVAARVLGPAGKGHLALVTNLAALCASFAAAGAAPALTALRSSSGMATARIVPIAVTIGVVFGSATVALVLMLHAGAGGAGLAGMSNGETAVACAVIVPLVVLTNVHHVLSLDGRMAVVSVTTLAGAAANTVVIAVLGVTDRLTVDRAIVAWAICSVLPLLLVCRPIGPVRLRLGTERLRHTLAAAMRANVSAIAVLAVWRVDVVIVNARRGFTELGLYTAAVSIAEVVLVAAFAIRFGLIATQGSPDRRAAADAVCVATRVGLLGTASLCGVMALATPLVLRWSYGAAFTGAAAASWWLLPGVVFLVLHFPLYDFLFTEGKSRLMGALAVGALGSNVLANIVFLDHHSYVAASVVSTCTYAALFAGCLAAFVSHTGRPVSEVILVKRADLVRLRLRR